MAQNPRDVGISWRACTCASIRRAIGASMLAFVLASMLSAAAPSAAARSVQAAAVAGDDANTCNQASGDVAIAACTRAIATGRYAGHDLAKLHYDRAVEYANKGDYDRAIADFSSAIHLDPTDADTHNDRGAAWLAKGENDRAFADFSEAIRLHPTDDRQGRLRSRHCRPQCGNSAQPQSEWFLRSRHRIWHEGRQRPRHFRLRRGDPSRPERR